MIGTLPDRPGGTFDHEGVPTQRTDLIRQGIIMGFITICSQPRKPARRAPANGQRVLLSPPQTRPTNICDRTGTTSLEAMLQQAGEGASGGTCFSAQAPPPRCAGLFLARCCWATRSSVAALRDMSKAWRWPATSTRDAARRYKRSAIPAIGQAISLRRICWSRAQVFRFDCIASSSY